MQPSLRATRRHREPRGVDVPVGSAVAARPGLCSVTYRQMAPRDVVACAADAGLAAVEWGGDRHVPPGDVGTAREVRALTVEAGLSTSSYGSYFRAGVTDFGEWPAVVRTAVALGAPRVRVWAGVVGSAGAGGEQRDAVVRALREAGRIAADHGIVVATEFHAGTLADSAAATIGLLDEVARPDVRPRPADRWWQRRSRPGFPRGTRWRRRCRSPRRSGPPRAARGRRRPAARHPRRRSRRHPH